MANKNNAVYIDVEEFFENALRYYSMNNMAKNEGISRSTVLRWLNKLKNERLDLREKLRETWNIKQNEFLINSHHPLRETIIKQTGKTELERRTFLKDINQRAINFLIHTWETPQIGITTF